LIGSKRWLCSRPRGISKIYIWTLEASASSGSAGAMGETTGHAIGHATGSTAIDLGRNEI